MMQNFSPIKIVIVDDEPHNVESLICYLDQFSEEYEILGVAHTVEEGKRLLLTHSPDLVFLDMKLPDGEGVELLSSIGSYRFHLIFFTAHREYALEAFEKGSIDYLLKPLELSSVSRAFKKFLQLHRSSVPQLEKTVEKKMAIPHKQGTLYLAPDEIIYIQAYGEYCYLVTQTNRILLSRTLKDVEQLVGDKEFVRIHRSYLINISKVKFFQQKGKALVTLSNGEELEVSRRKKEDVAKAIEARSLSI